MKGSTATVNSFASLAPRLRTMLALLIVLGASLAAVPQAVMAQRIAPPPAGTATTSASTGTTLGAPGHSSVPGKGKPGPQSSISQAQLQQLIESMQQQNAAQVPKSPIATKAPWLTHTFAGIFLIAAIGLVALLAFQTTKQEGLSGTIGGRVEAAYRPRLGFDQQLQRVTTFAAVTFVVFATIVSFTGI